MYTDPAPSRSVTPEGAAATVAHLRGLGFDALLLWGVEHWHMRWVRHGDPSWWERMLPFFPHADTDQGAGEMPDEPRDSHLNASRDSPAR